MSHHWARITKDQWRRVLSILGTVTTEDGIDEDLVHQFNQEELDYELDEDDPGGPPIPFDTTPPAIPTGLVAVGGLKAVSFDWDDNVEPDFAEYQLEISTEVDFSNRVAFLRGRVSFAHWEGDYDETYYGRIRAVDTWGNASPWSSTVSASTASAPGGGSDGNPPSSSPTPSVLGLPGSIFVYWNPVANADPVSYEVHVIDESTRSGDSGWTPSASTLAGEGVKTRAMVSDKNSVPLVDDVNYYVKLIAKDDDGAASASSEAGPVKINEEGVIRAGMFEAVLIYTKIIELYDTMGHQTIDIDGTTGILTFGPDNVFKLQFGAIENPVRYWDGSSITRFSLDADGNVFLSGRVDWGSGSRLYSDVVELAQYGGGGSFQIPALVQKDFKVDGAVSSVTINWPSQTSNKDLLLLYLVLRHSSPPTVSGTPSGWTLVHTVGSGNVRHYLYKIEGASPRTSETVNLSETYDSVVVGIAEFSGIEEASAQDKTATNTGDGGGSPDTLSTGTTATTAQTHELAISAFGFVLGGGAFPGPEPPDVPTTWSTLKAGDFGGSHLWAYKILTTTQTVSASTAADSVNEWTGSVVTFKAKTGSDVADPPSGKIRVYSKEGGLFAKDGAGTIHELTNREVAGHLHTPVAVRAWRSAAASHTSNGNFQQVPFDTEDFDVGNMFASNRFTVPTGMGGRWRITARVTFTGNSTGNNRQAKLVKNVAGTPVDLDRDIVQNSLSVAQTLLCTFVGNLAAGDTVDVQASQNAAASLAYVPGTEQMWFSAVYLGPS